MADVDEKPVAWLHTMHQELGQKSKRVTLAPENPWGLPGKDYSEEYIVTSDALYPATAITTLRRERDEARAALVKEREAH